MAEAVYQFPLSAVQPIGRLNEQRLDICPAQATFGQPRVCGGETRILRTELLIGGPHPVVRTVGQFYIALAGLPALYAEFIQIVGTMLVVGVSRRVRCMAVVGLVLFSRRSRV